MTLLLIGLGIFFAMHLVPVMTGIKAALKQRMGEKGYAGMFSLVSLAGLVLIVWGYANSEWVTVYDPPTWGRHVTLPLVAVAFILLASANMKGRIRKTLKHPMLIGIALWGTGHLFANGDLASVVLFASFVAYAIVDSVLATAQGRIAQFDVVPRHDVMALVGGLVAYVAFMFLHPYIIGVYVV